MSRRLQIPGEREESALLAACEQALERARATEPHSWWPEPGSYLAADMALLGLEQDQAGLEASLVLQNGDGGFPAYWGGPSHVDTSARVWAAMQLNGIGGDRVARLAAALKSMGGVDALAHETRLEWALLGLIPSDRAPELSGSKRAGGRTLSLDLSEIGGSGTAARSQGGWKTWFSRRARRLDELEHGPTSDSALDPRCRVAWLATTYSGRQAPAPGANLPIGHSTSFGGDIAATLQAQETDGSWRDDEGFIHGTWQALLSLKAAGYDDHEAEVLRAGEWLRSAQNADCGWGETGASNVSHAAWALMGLIAGGDPASESATKGLEYLLAAQSVEGLWRERAWTRTVCPRLAFARDEARAQADAILAIEEFARVTTGTRGTNG